MCTVVILRRPGHPWPLILGANRELEDLTHPLLKQIANKAPGTWQHSLMMANMAEIAANAIGANGRLVRVGGLVVLIN